MKIKKLFPLGSLVLALLFALVMLITYLIVKPPAPPSELQGVLRPEFRMLAPFHLQSHNHGPIDETSLRGKWSFVFFGYLSCPDVCPNTLHELNSLQRLVKDDSGSDLDDLQVIFISVDPDRDSTENLAQYVSHFNKEFIGATAGKGAIDRLTRQFGVGYIKETETAPGQYLVTHTSAIFLVDPHGRLVATFSQPHYASTLMTQYKKISAYFSGTG